MAQATLPSMCWAVEPGQASGCPQRCLTSTLYVTEVLGACKAVVAPPGRIQLENAVLAAAVRIVVHEGGVKATLIVCHAQPWGREGVDRR